MLTSFNYIWIFLPKQLAIFTKIDSLTCQFWLCSPTWYIFFDHMVDIKALLNTQASYKLDFFSPILCSWVMIFAVKLHFFSNLPHQFDFQHTIFQLWVNVCESYWYIKYFLKVDDLSQSSFLSTSIFFGFSDYFLQRCIFVPHLYHNVLTVVRIMTTTKKKIRLLHKICCEFFYFY